MNTNKLTTKLSTKVIMNVAGLMCKVWKYGRSKYNNMSDFDYHIKDLRSQYPNELVYKNAVGNLPFYDKINEIDDEYEKTSSIKIGDCHLRYTFDKSVRKYKVEDETKAYLHTEGNPREPMIRNLITQTQIRHNEPKSLKVFNSERKGESNGNVVNLHSK